MKKRLLSIVLLCSTVLSFAQFTTGRVSLATGYFATIDTNASTVTLRLEGPSNVWMGIGFGGNGMATANDMFIWNSSSNRDYSSTGQGNPSADAAANQSWTVTTDNVASGIRTVVATRSLVSVGDYTFLNNNSNIPIIFALGSSINLSYHDSRSFTTLSRTQLGVEDFSLNASSIYPNPSNGNFVVKTKSALESIEIYTHTGALVKSISVNAETNTEVNMEGLSTGIYLLELKNATDKTWKKIIVE